MNRYVDRRLAAVDLILTIRPHAFASHSAVLTAVPGVGAEPILPETVTSSTSLLPSLYLQNLQVCIEAGIPRQPVFVEGLQ